MISRSSSSFLSSFFVSIAHSLGPPVNRLPRDRQWVPTCAVFSDNQRRIHIWFTLASPTYRRKRKSYCRPVSFKLETCPDEPVVASTMALSLGLELNVGAFQRLPPRTVLVQCNTSFHITAKYKRVYLFWCIANTQSDLSSPSKFDYHHLPPLVRTMGGTQSFTFTYGLHQVFIGPSSSVKFVQRHQHSRGRHPCTVPF